MNTARHLNWQSVTKVFLHILCWIVFLSLPILFIDQQERELISIITRPAFFLFVLSYVFIFYSNADFAVPWLINTKKYIIYFSGLLLAGAILGFYLKPFEKFTTFHNTTNPPPDFRTHNNPFQSHRPNDRKARTPIPRIDVASLYIFFLIVSSGALLRILEYWSRSIEKSRNIENDRIKAELSLLRARIHPHFLFNSLNGIYALALTGDSLTADSIHRLSQLMRYYMEETSDEKIKLHKEMQAIKDFISLQRLRIGKNCTIIEEYSEIPDEKEIHAFLLLPFVENAFKYGLSSREQCWFRFTTEWKNNAFYFIAENSISNEKSIQYRSGNGLKITKEILEHYYKDRFDLYIYHNKDVFKIKLSIKF